MAIALSPTGVHGHRRPGRRDVRLPGLAGRRRADRRCTCSTPTSRPTAPQLAAGHRPAVRRRHRAPAAPGDRARHRRRAGPAGPRATTPQVFHTNEGHAGFLGARAHPRAGRSRAQSFAEALEAVRAGERLHHPHPGAGRHRPLPARPDGAATSPASPTRCGITFDDLMALGQRDDEPDETRFNMAVMGLRLAGRGQRRRPSCTARSAARCSPGCGPTSPSTRCRSARSPTACTPTPGSAPEIDRRCWPRACCPVWDGADEADWARVDRHPRRRAVAGREQRASAS